MKTPFLKSIRYTLLLFTLWSTTGCVHLIYLDQAQHSFNKAATIENAQRFTGAQANEWAAESQAAQDALAPTNTPEFYYSLAYGQVHKSLQRRANLKRNGVLSTAYTLQALCEWKLGNYKDAEESAKNSLKAMKESQVRLPRDEAMMTALPGLMKTDQAYAVYQEIYTASFDTFTDVLNDPAAAKAKYLEFSKKFIKDWDNTKQRPLAFAYYQKALKEVPGINDETKFYLLTAQLGAAKTWLETRDKLETIFRKLFEIENQPWLAQETAWIQNERKWLNDNLCQYQNVRTELLAELKNLAPKVAGANKETVVKNWNNWLVDFSSKCR